MMNYENEVQVWFPWFNDSLALFVDEMNVRLSEDAPENEMYAKLLELTQNFRDELDKTIKENS